MSFIITIEEIKKVDRMENGAWVRLRDNESEDKPQYGYAPNRIENKQEKVEIYKQVVENLNLVAVINAVNKVNMTENR